MLKRLVVVIFIVVSFKGVAQDFSTLWERGDILPTAGYTIGSVILSIGALFLAMALTRSLVS